MPAALLVAVAAFGTNYLAHHTWAIPYAHRESGDNWYDFRYIKDGKVRESYWANRAGRSKIDQGELGPRYALHVLVGHHGIFSLSPMWLLSIVGLAMLCAGRDPAARVGIGDRGRVARVRGLLYSATARRSELRRHDQRLSLGILDAPLWLMAMQPAADWASRRRSTQILAAALLAFSVMSVSYPTWNPWTQPWLWDALEAFPG